MSNPGPAADARIRSIAWAGYFFRFFLHRRKFICGTGGAQAGPVERQNAAESETNSFFRARPPRKRGFGALSRRKTLPADVSAGRQKTAWALYPFPRFFAPQPRTPTFLAKNIGKRFLSSVPPDFTRPRGRFRTLMQAVYSSSFCRE